MRHCTRIRQVAGYAILIIVSLCLFRREIHEILTLEGTHLTVLPKIPDEYIWLGFIPFIFLLPYTLSNLRLIIPNAMYHATPLHDIIYFSVTLFALILSKWIIVCAPIIFLLICLALLLIAVVYWFRHYVLYESLIIKCVLALTLLGGFMLRWMAFLRKIGHVLDPDAEGFYQLALNTKTVFTATMASPPFAREPFFIWLIKGWFLIVPSTRASLRLLTLLLSIAVLVTIFHLSRIIFQGMVTKRLTPPLALLTTALAALNPQYIFMSNRGLRFELYLALTLLFVYVCLHPVGRSAFIKIAIPALIGSVMCLTRVSTHSWMAPVLIILAIKFRWKWFKPLLIALIPLLILIPHFITNYYTTPGQDPFFTANIHARFYRNIEFKDQPGFPTSEEIQQNAWAGERITFFRYLFGRHSMGTLIAKSLEGFKRLFLTTHPLLSLFNSRVLVVGYLIGVVYLLLRRQWHIPLIMFFLVAPVIYLAGIGIDWRLVGTLSPFFLICLVSCIPLASDIAFMLLKRKSAD